MSCFFRLIIFILLGCFGLGQMAYAREESPLSHLNTKRFGKTLLKRERVSEVLPQKGARMASSIPIKASMIVSPKYFHEVVDEASEELSMQLAVIPLVDLNQSSRDSLDASFQSKFVQGDYVVFGLPNSMDFIPVLLAKVTRVDLNNIQDGVKNKDLEQVLMRYRDMVLKGTLDQVGADLGMTPYQGIDPYEIIAIEYEVIISDDVWRQVKDRFLGVITHYYSEPVAHYSIADYGIRAISNYSFRVNKKHQNIGETEFDVSMYLNEEKQGARASSRTQIRKLSLLFERGIHYVSEKQLWNVQTPVRFEWPTRSKFFSSKSV